MISPTLPPGVHHTVMWMRCAEDGADHAVTDDDFAAGRSSGRVRAICEHRVTVDSMVVAGGPVCPRCRSIAWPIDVRARPTTPRRHRKPRLWRRLFRHAESPAVPVRMQPQSPSGTAGPMACGREAAPLRPRVRRHP